MVSNQTLKIKYLNPFLNKLEQKEGSDWVDLRSSITIEIKKDEFCLIPLGICVEIPSGFEAHIVPRSSTFKNFGIIQTNHMGVIDNSYSGDNDIWFFPAYALRDTTINFNDRICQFRIIEKQPKLEFEEVETLRNKARGGCGSTGIQ